MRLWPPPFGTGNILNSFFGVENPNTVGSNLNMATALQGAVGGVLGGGPTADQGGSGGGMTGGAGDNARAPGPGPNGGGGAGPNGGSGGSDGGAAPTGGRTIIDTCGKSTPPPTPDPHDSLNRSPSPNTINNGGNGGSNATETSPMPGGYQNSCNGGSGSLPVPLGCPPCEELARQRARGHK